MADLEALNSRMERRAAALRELTEFAIRVADRDGLDDVDMEAVMEEVASNFTGTTKL